MPEHAAPPMPLVSRPRLVLLPRPQAPQVRDGRARIGRSRQTLRHRVELAGVLLATAVLYLWNLGASGWANPFYSAAAQAGSQDWAAWFFGSSDAANSITVDKPPASLWIMGLSVRIFGLNSWSILVPEALMGVATAWLLYLAVRRTAAPATGDPGLAHRAGLLAAVVMAITPVATLMFRFNNPDALLVLLMTAAGYATLRSIQDHKLRWLLLAGVFLGFGFLTKQLQVLLVVPGFAVAYAVAAQGGVGRRLLRLLGAGAAMVGAAAWWLAVVELIPADMRPYIGGSQNNSILELTLGYNGLGRLSGQETGSVGGGNGWGVPGLFRMFNSEFGGQIAWLLPSVLILGAGLLWLGRHAPRTDAVRASVIVWGGGCSSPGWSSASWPASSIPTTQWRWLRASPGSPAWAGCFCGSVADSSSPRHFLPSPWQARDSWPPIFWAAPQPMAHSCAGWCSLEPSRPRRDCCSRDA